MARVMRFVTPHITVERIELALWLRPGRNVAVILHHQWGVPTFQRSPGGEPGLALAGDMLNTEQPWRWREAPEFLAHPHQTIGGDAHRIRFPVVIDARREWRGLHRADFDDAAWKRARRVTSVAWKKPVLKETAPLDREEVFPRRVTASGVVSRPPVAGAPFPAVPMSWLAKNSKYTRTNRAVFRAAELLLRRGQPAELRPGMDGYLTLDFGRPVHGYVKLEIDSAGPGTILDFLYGEIRVDPATGKRVLLEDGSFDPELVVGAPFGDRVILRGGRQSIEIPEERTARWLMLAWTRCRRPVLLRSVSFFTSQHPVTVRGSFSGGGAAVAGIIRLSLDHARVTMSDTYVDTPGREDAQWLEDIQYRARLAACWFGDVALRQVTLRHTAEQQPAGGRFRVFCPEAHGRRGVQAADWGMAWIGMLHDDCQWTGETTRLARYFPNLVRFLDSLHRETDADGMLIDRSSFTDIRISARADFARGEQESIPAAWYFGFLRQAVAIAQATGQLRLAAEWSGRAEKIRQGFARFLVGAKGEHPRVAEVWSPDRAPFGFGQAATVSAIYHGVVAPGLHRGLLRSAFLPPDGRPPAGTHRWNNPTYAYRVLRCLCENGRGRLAGRHFLERYRPYLPDGPLPEYFLSGSAAPADSTGSHGWAAVPLLWLHDTVLGLRLAGPGGGELRWNPVDVGWPRVQGTTMTPRGPCRVEIDWTRKKFRLSAPKGVKIRSQLPAGAHPRIITE